MTKLLLVSVGSAGVYAIFHASEDVILTISLACIALAWVVGIAAALTSSQGRQPR